MVMTVSRDGPGAGIASAPAALIEILDARLRWLSAWPIHIANHLRASGYGLKV